MNPPERPRIRAGGRVLGGGRPFLIAGPCVLESRELTLSIAARLAEICAEHDLPLVFKASFDKANRTSASAARGPGMREGLGWLAEARERTGALLLTDVHLPEQCAPAAEVVDILQIPAFLCRQTDLLLAAGETGRAVNVKKGQFLAPWDAPRIVEKVLSTGNRDVLLTERGSSFGYGRLVVDMGGLHHLASAGVPLVMDATHAVQEPGSLAGRTGGDRERAPELARAAFATGHVDGLFCEVHPDPDSSPSDGPNMLFLESFPAVLAGVLAVHAAVHADPR